MAESTLEKKLCLFPKFGEMFGKPMQGIHKTRIFGVAAFDLFATIAVAYLIAMYAPKKYSNNKIILFVCSFAVLMVFSVFFHAIFCVPTPFTKKVLSKL